MFLAQKQQAMRVRNRELRTVLRYATAAEQSSRFIAYLDRCKNMWVYLLGNIEHGWFKIGISKLPERRVSDLQILPFELKLITTVAVGPSRKRALFVEKRLHMHYVNNKIRGEWFKDIDTKDFLTKVQEFSSQT